MGIAVLARPRAFCAVLASPGRTTRITVPAGDQAQTAILVLRAAPPGRSDDARAEAAAAGARAGAAAGARAGAAGGHAEAAATGAHAGAAAARAGAAARARAAVLARARPLGSPQAASTIGPSGLAQAALG